MLEVEDIHLSLGGKHLLNGVTFQIPEGAMAGMFGPSGGGKSMLLKIIAGILPADSGEVRHPAFESGDVALMFQEGALFDSLNVFDNVAFPLVGGRVPTFLNSRARQEEVHASVGEILARACLSKASKKFPGQLSGGMRRRVSLARALVTQPSLVLLDDPTSGLDPVASAVIMELITELHHEYNPTMLMVSQDLRRLLPNVKHIIGLFDGAAAFSGTLDDLRAADQPEIKHFVTCRFDLNKGQDSARL